MAEPHVRTEVQPGPDGPVLVRTALDDEGREALGREADRLERARHPGVVEVRAASADALTLAWAGSETLATAHPTVVAAAAVLASVAATVADLHGLGIVHGRLEPSHVVLGADGRPRLCGLRGVEPHERRPGPADDVAALGALIDHLVGSDADLEPIPERRWRRRRWSGYQRRVLLTIADRATDPDPARRPTARELARAIAEAVPEATLPAPPPPPATPAATEPEAEPPPTGPVRPAAPPPPLPRRVPGRITTSSPAPSSAAPPPTPDAHPTDPPERDAAITAPTARPARTIERGAVLRVVAATVVVVAVLGVASWLGPDHSGPGGDTAAPTRARTTSTTATTIAAGPARSAACDPVDGAGDDDLDGDGCPDPYRVDGTTVRALGRTFEVGRPGDHVQVGDWDCDGSATPAVVRPSTGEVFLFGSWDRSGGPVTVRAVDVVVGARSLRVDRGPACVPVVLVADGGTTPLDLGGAAS